MGRAICHSYSGVTDTMKVLVTGATGFIGNHVVEYLLKSGIDVIATSRNIDKARSFGWFGSVNYIQYDLHTPIHKNLFTLLKEPDLLIHLAWEGLPHYKDLFHFERNLPENYAFIKNMVQNGLKKISVAGTCLEYGMQNGCLDEEAPAMPDTPYSIAKDTLRKYIHALSGHYRFDYAWIRLFYLYGKGQNDNAILNQLDRAVDNNEEVFDMSGGEQLRDYLPVEKAAEYIVKISMYDKQHGIFNCCSGRPVSIRKLVEDHLKTRGKHIKLNLGRYDYPDYEPMAFWGCSRKLESVII